MNLKQICIFSALTTVATLATAASTPEDCAAITDDARRLACYDNFFQNQPVKPISKPPAPTQRTVEPSVPPAKTMEAKPEQQIITTTKEDYFGKEQVQSEDKVNALISRAIGNFSTWKKGMKVNLENGQVWEIRNSRSTYHKISNPEVKITRGALGSYDMEIEGMNRQFKVRRVK